MLVSKVESKMFNQIKEIMKTKILTTLVLAFLCLTSCSDDDDAGGTPIMPESKTYPLMSVSDPSIMGTVTFEKTNNNMTRVMVELEGTEPGDMHPAHIHMNTAAEGGDIAVSLEPIDGSTGMSTTTFSQLNNGMAITYEDLLNFDGYVNVHKSADDLATLVAQGDIGQNELTMTSKTYALGSVDVPGIMGEAKFTKRVNGTALIEVMLENTPANGMHPGHIHMNTAAEGGAIALSLTPVNGATGMSKTQAGMLDNGDMITYDELMNFDGYINIHKSADDLATLVAQGDIGQNELTMTSKTYALGSVDVPGIMGEAKFTKRVNGTALIEVMLENTPANGMHPGHIHMNTAAEGGAIALSLTPVNGATGMSKTQAGMLDNGDMITYDELMNFDGYINIHKSADDLATLVAQGDIGQNELTGEMMSYNLNAVSGSGVMGDATFYERMNGEALLVIELMGTMAGDMHPAHIHMGDVNNPGGIAVSLTQVMGDTGISKTNIAMKDDNTVFGYDDALAFGGYINIHKSMADLATIVAQGDIGSNSN